MQLDDEMETIEQVIRDNTADSSEEDEIPAYDKTQDRARDLVWDDVTGLHLKQFPFRNGDAGIKAHIYDSYFDKSPADFYYLFVTDDVFSMMVLENKPLRSSMQGKRIGSQGQDSSLA